MGLFHWMSKCILTNQNAFKQEKINWDQRKKDLDELVEQYRGHSDYDCIVPFSGGKDSTWQTITCLEHKT